MLVPDQVAWTKRLLQLIPGAWSAEGERQIGGGLYALCNALAQVLAQANALEVYVGLQTRLLTATGTNLEAIADDFFGIGVLPRGQTLNALNVFVPQSDAQYALSIQQAVIGPKNTCQAIAYQVQQYINNYYAVDSALNTTLMGLDVQGGLDTVGVLDGVPVDIPALPGVMCFDIQSNPVLAAQVPLTAGQFAILFTYGGLRTAGFFLGYAGKVSQVPFPPPTGTYLSGPDGVPLTYEQGQPASTGGSFLLNPNIQVLSGPLSPQLGALVERIKVCGMQPVYCDNRNE